MRYGQQAGTEKDTDAAHASTVPSQSIPSHLTDLKSSCTVSIIGPLHPFEYVLIGHEDLAHVSSPGNCSQLEIYHLAFCLVSGNTHCM